MMESLEHHAVTPELAIYVYLVIKPHIVLGGFFLVSSLYPVRHSRGPIHLEDLSHGILCV
jgi:hypothetical protein